jgi:DNA-binding NarL/FixJ family response regulator
VVDDHETFRQFVRSKLGERTEIQVVGVAADGLEAINKAKELRPDLILLDIGLPCLNGIEAARQIRKIVPESKILFLSQESDPDLVQEALSVGAAGYVLKARAGRELLAAVAAINQGKRFVSTGLASQVFFEPTDGQEFDRPRLDVWPTLPPEAD